jgi:uncharacterized protein (DUF362 family)
MQPLIESDEIWIKPNLSIARPPETGCIIHPISAKALVDCLFNVFDFKKPVRFVETKTFHKGQGMTELLLKLPPNEKVTIEEKLRYRDLNEDIHDFGFNFLLELSKIKRLVELYQEQGFDVGVINLSKESVMAVKERKELVDKLEQMSSKKMTPLEEIRDRIVNHIPKMLRKNKIGLISLAVPKTYDDPDVVITSAMKNVAVGLHPRYKGFMHKDLARAIVYNYLLWKIACEDRVFGLVSGPYGMDCEGPLYGRTVDFPYVIAGSDLLKVDCTVLVLMFGNIEIAKQLTLFRHANHVVGKMPQLADLKRLACHSLSFKPSVRSPSCLQAQTVTGFF